MRFKQETANMTSGQQGLEGAIADCGASSEHPHGGNSGRNSVNETRFDLKKEDVTKMLAFLSQNDPDALRCAVKDFAREHPDEYRETVPDVYDSQTGTFSKTYFENELLPEAIRRAQQEGNPFSVAIVDLDHFKEVNDTYGHNIGYQVLQLVAETLRQNVRIRDVLPFPRQHDHIGRMAGYKRGENTSPDEIYQVARIGGGEEFAILLHGANLDQAYMMGERVRSAVECKSLHTEEHGDIGVTVSIGVVEYAHGMEPELLMGAADKAVYGAKRRGRNRVCKARLNPPMPVPSSSKLTSPQLTPSEQSDYSFTNTTSKTTAA